MQKISNARTLSMRSPYRLSIIRRAAAARQGELSPHAPREKPAFKSDHTLGQHVLIQINEGSSAGRHIFSPVLFPMPRQGACRCSIHL
jgi:hypothetical protein